MRPVDAGAAAGRPEPASPLVTLTRAAPAGRCSTGTTTPSPRRRSWCSAPPTSAPPGPTVVTIKCRSTSPTSTSRGPSPTHPRSTRPPRCATTGSSPEQRWATWPMPRTLMTVQSVSSTCVAGPPLRHPASAGASGHHAVRHGRSWAGAAARPSRSRRTPASVSPRSCGNGTNHVTRRWLTSTYTFTNVQANQTIAVTFTQSQATITSSAGAGGSISPNGTQTVAIERHADLHDHAE